jgi:hypothetical protein
MHAIVRTTHQIIKLLLKPPMSTKAEGLLLGADEMSESRNFFSMNLRKERCSMQATTILIFFVLSGSSLWGDRKSVV